MKVSAAMARRFSECLLEIYAAESEAAVVTVLRVIEPEFSAAAGHGWLVGLIHGHAEHRREQLRRGLNGAPPEIANLTRREQEVLRRIALGETDAVIGQTLGIAPKTASKHVENILRKLGVETRTAAALQLRPVRP